MAALTLLFLAGTASAALLERMTDSYIRRGVEYDFGYSVATLYKGVQASYKFSGNESVASWYKDQVDGILYDNGTIVDWELDFYSLDEYRIGNDLLWWYQRTNETKYKTAADTIRHQMDRHPRNPSGGFWHRQPSYPDQQWLDGIFMADVFYGQWTKMFDAENTTAWDDIVLQFDLIEEFTRNHTTNLLVHGYDESKTAVWADPVTGAAPIVWSRAVGWYFMALLEIIEIFPESHAGHARLVEYFTTLADGLVASQDEASGGWWIVMSEPYVGVQGNYIESSADAMFAYGLLGGVRLGLLDETYAAPAATAYEALVNDFVSENNDGTLNFLGTVEVGSLGSDASYEVSLTC